QSTKNSAKAAFDHVQSSNRAVKSLAEEPMPFEPRAIGQTELMQGDIRNRANGFLGGIAHQDVFDINRVDCLLRYETRAHEVQERAPKLAAHEHERELSNLARLNKGGGLENFVQRAKTARQSDEGVGVFDKHQLADIEMTKGDPSVQIAVGLLFLRQLDVAADRVAARLLG